MWQITGRRGWWMLKRLQNLVPNESCNKLFPNIKMRLYVNSAARRPLCQTLCKTWTHRQMGEVHHGHSAVHVSSVASFGRVVIFIPFVLTAVGNLSALRRAGESVWPTRSPIWIENPVSALTRVPVRSRCNWEWVSCPWFILLSQYDWASLLSPESGAKIEHFTLRAWNPSTACMHFLRVFHATRSRRTLCVVLNETKAPEYLGVLFRS